jgi:heptosyltransferase I
MSDQHFRRALFVRLDRIGDLVLTLPTDTSVSIDRVDWWIPRGLSFVTAHSIPERMSQELPKSLGLTEIFTLARAVRKNRYDLAIVYHAPWWVSFALWLARVPVRIGVLSQWHSFLFFNHGVRQKRSRAEVSELEYNFRLLEEGLGRPRGSLVRKTLRLDSKSGRPEALTSRLTSRDISEYFVVHPGMGGSALNWSPHRYASLIEELARKNDVVITGTSSDDAFLSPIRKILSRENARIIWLDGKLSGTDLISVLQNARAVVAPSTGVLHLAASTGVPTLGLFSQILVQRAVRWGPQGARTAILEPRLTCPGAKACEGTACAQGNCMDSIAVSDVVSRLNQLISNH